jgi:GTP-binding protein
VLAVNKRDVRAGYDASEFHALGADRLFQVAAEHGTGVDDLLDEIVRLTPEPATGGAHDALGLAILGRPNVGKSSFLNALLGDERAIVTDIPGTTRDVVEETFKLDERTYRLLDTAGIRKRSKVNEAVEYYSVSRAIDVIERSDVVLLVLDATEGPAAQDKKLASLIETRSKGLVVVANKMDLVPPDLKDPVKEWVRDQLSFVGYAPAVFTSALRKRNIKAAVRRAAKVYDAGGRQISNKMLREKVVPRLERKPPAYNCRVTGISQVGTRPPLFRVRLNRQETLKPAYLRFIAAEIRRVRAFEGYPVRLHTAV